MALNKSSLFLKIILENTQTLQIFTIYRKYSQKLLKMPSWRGWEERSIGLSKEWVECERKVRATEFA